MKKVLKIIYNVTNEIFVYGLYINYTAYYCMVNMLHNWYEALCKIKRYDYSKISTCFQGWSVTDRRSAVCTKMTDNSGKFCGYIHNEIWSYFPNIGDWRLYSSDKTIVNSHISVTTDNCYREYIIS